MANTTIGTDRSLTALQVYSDAVFMRSDYKFYFAESGDLTIMASDGHALLGPMNGKALSDADPAVSGAMFYTSDVTSGYYVLCVSSGV